jgi:4'-phosphopantetheinyl transferase
LPGITGSLMAAPPMAGDGLHILTIKTPATPIRDSARLLVRQALHAALAQLLAVDKVGISLISTHGLPVRLAPPWEHIGISFSHEPGLSLAAIHLAGPVGIDLMRLGKPLPDIERLARDYLGPEAAAAIAGQAGERQQLAFAQAWVCQEARLKCLALPMTEWTPELDKQLARCCATNLTMPVGWIAAVARRC